MKNTRSQQKNYLLKRISIAITLVLLTLTLGGCGNIDECVTAEPETEITPNVERVGNYWGYHYLIDKNTNVVYLEYYDTVTHKGFYGVTVMLNADGTPVTADQLDNFKR